MEILDSGRCVLSRIKRIMLLFNVYSFETYQPPCQSNTRTATRVSQAQQQADDIYVM